jgi:hypothetical protein
MNVEIGRMYIIILFRNNKFAQFHFWESEPDFYIGFSPALHMQCAGFLKSLNECLSVEILAITFLQTHSLRFFFYKNHYIGKLIVLGGGGGEGLTSPYHFF